MFFFDLLEIFGWLTDAVAGWSWEAVERGIYSWAAESAVASVEFVYVALTERTSPQVDSAWYRWGFAAPVYRVALYVGSTAAALQAARLALSNRPELIGPSLVRSGQLGVFIGAGTWFIAAVVRAGDVLSAMLLTSTGPVVELLLEAYIAEMLNPESPVLGSLIGVALALLVVIGMFTSVAALLVRNILVYVVAAYGAIPLAMQVEESHKGYLRELVLAVVTLALSPSVMIFSLAVSSASVMREYSIGDAGETRLSGFGLVASSLSLAITGFVPFALYRFLPVLSQGMGITGVVAGVGKSLAGVAQSALLGASLGSAASRMVSAVAKRGGSTPPPPGGSGGSGGQPPSGGSGWSKASSVVVATNPIGPPSGGAGGPAGGAMGGGSLAGAVGRGSTP